MTKEEEKVKIKGKRKRKKEKKKMSTHLTHLQPQQPTIQPDHSQQQTCQ